MNPSSKKPIDTSIIVIKNRIEYISSLIGEKEQDIAYIHGEINTLNHTREELNLIISEIDGETVTEERELK